MDDIRFERHFRTPYSEGYYIMQGSSLQSNNRLGTVDIHFTTTAVHGTLILERELEEPDLTKLIEQIDEDLVSSLICPGMTFSCAFTLVGILVSTAMDYLPMKIISVEAMVTQ